MGCLVAIGCIFLTEYLVGHPIEFWAKLIVAFLGCMVWYSFYGTLNKKGD
jgi:TM2 domain-containing membrane protein YozV